MLYISFYDEKGEVVGTEGGMYASIIQSVFNSKMPFVEGDWYGQPVYVKNEEIVYKQKNPAIIKENKITNVPANSIIKIDAKTYECKDGGDVELNFGYKGTYKITLVSWPYLDKEFEIDYQP